jgi:hypothetical protein
MLCYTEEVALNHGEICYASACESGCAMVCQWLGIVMCYTEQWLLFMVCYTEQVVLNHGVIFCASGCESGCAMVCQWIGIVVCYAESVVVNHGALY